MRNKMKGILSVILIFGMALSLLPFNVYATDADGSYEDAKTDVSGYYGSQLANADEEEFYKAIGELDFKSGTDSIDISDRVTEELLVNYIDHNDSAFAQAFQKARDAYMYDHAELFYVDWAKISIRVGKSGNDYQAFVGNGAYDNFYVTGGFTNASDIEAAIETANAKMDEIVAAADAAAQDKGLDTAVTYVHNKIAELTTYTYRDNASDDVAPFISNVYGVLGKGSALCEGYARTFKMAMDRLGIPCVMVRGAALRGDKQGGDAEDHMWNYVQLDGNWYGVDVTFDDPIMTARSEGIIRNNYLLKGSDFFLANRQEDGRFSQSGYIFSYPELNKTNYGITEEGEEQNPLQVETYSGNQEQSDGSMVSYTYFKPYYNGEDAGALRGNGQYIGGRRVLEDGTFSKWYALDVIDAFEQNNYLEAYASEFTTYGYQFCVYTSDEDKKLNINEADIIATSKVYEMYSENQMLYSPFVVAATPVRTLPLVDKESFHVTITYDQPLQQKNEGEKAGVSVDADFSNPNCEVSNFTWHNETDPIDVGDQTKTTRSIVEFDFKPDTSYNYSGTVYTFSLTNLVSQLNGTTPHTFGYTWRTRKVNVMFCPLMPPPSNYLLSPYPRLMTNECPAGMLNDPMGNLISGSDSLNIALLASKPSVATQGAMDTALDNAGVDADKVYASYDLAIGCQSVRSHIRQDIGQTLSIALPYPKGFDPRVDTETTFEAYHFKEDPKGSGNYVAEPLECIITPEGLWVIAKDFSPFTVIQTNKADRTEYTAAAMVNAEMAEATVDGGDASGIQKLNEENAETTYHFAAKEGYQIARLRIFVDGVETDPVQVDGDSTDYTLKFADMTGNVSITAECIAASVAQEEALKGFEAVEPAAALDKLDVPDVNWESNDSEYSEGNSDAVTSITGEKGQDVDNTGGYEERTLGNSEVAIKGQFTKDANVTVGTFDETNEFYQAFISQINAETERLTAAYNVVLAAGGFEGNLDVTMNIGDGYKGKTVRVLSNGNEAGEVVSQSVTADETGNITINVTALSPLVVVAETEKEPAEYVEKEFGDSNIKIHGKFTEESEVTFEAIDGGSPVYQAFADKIDADKEELQAVYNLNLTGASSGNISVTIAGDYAEKSVRVLKYNNESGEVTDQTAVIDADGNIALNVMSLTPLAVIVEKEEPQPPAAEYVDKDFEESNVKISGKFTADTTVAITALDETSEIQQAFTAKIDALKEQLDAAYDIVMNGASKGILNVTLKGDYAGKKIHVLSYSNGTIVSPAASVDEAGNITVKVSSLTPLAVVVDNSTEEVGETVISSSENTESGLPGVSIRGKFEAGTKVKVVPLSEEDPGYKAFIEKVSEGKKLIGLCDISLIDGKLLGDSMEISFSIGKEYIGQNVRVFHYIDDKVEILNALVEKASTEDGSEYGKVVITVKFLSPFAIEVDDPEYKPVKDPADDPKDDPTEEPKKDPVEDPTKDPAKDPTKDPAEDPVEDPAKNPVKEPNQNSGGNISKNPVSGNNSDAKASDTKPKTSNKKAAAKTGDTAKPVLLITLLLASGLLVLVLVKKKKSTRK